MRLMSISKGEICIKKNKICVHRRKSGMWPKGADPRRHPALFRTWSDENGTRQRRSNFELYQSYNESDIVNFIKIQRIKREGLVVRMHEDRTTKKSSMLNQLAHDERAGQTLDRLMA
ncbi:hypothetical protein TNCV_1834031 [Trichonephila clavipes]|nr:hypothetical protein TNCV_1834031 [Trichonephila clavipes]